MISKAGKALRKVKRENRASQVCLFMILSSLPKKNKYPQTQSKLAEKACKQLSSPETNTNTDQHFHQGTSLFYKVGS